MGILDKLLSFVSDIKEVKVNVEEIKKENSHISQIIKKETLNKRLLQKNEEVLVELKITNTTYKMLYEKGIYAIAVENGVYFFKLSDIERFLNVHLKNYRQAG